MLSNTRFAALAAIKTHFFGAITYSDMAAICRAAPLLMSFSLHEGSHSHALGNTILQLLTT